MEAKTNEAAYLALKRLERDNILKFELRLVVTDRRHIVLLIRFCSALVEELIKVAHMVQFVE